MQQSEEHTEEDFDGVVLEQEIRTSIWLKKRNVSFLEKPAVRFVVFVLVVAAIFGSIYYAVTFERELPGADQILEAPNGEI